MSWIFVALLAPALSALGSYTDKYLLVHHERTGGLGSVLLFSCLFGALIFPVSLVLGVDIASVTVFEAVVLIFNGFLTVGTLAAYLYAIRDSDVISVVPVLQTIPVFGFIFGFLILGETLTSLEIAGSLIIVLSALLLSFEIEESSRMRFRARSFFLALLSSFLFAISGVVFKLFALDKGYWVTQFWEYVGVFFIGVILFICISSYRKSFLRTLTYGKTRIVMLNFSTETIMVSADLLLNFAVLLAPVALVYAVNSTQPAFLLTFALLGWLMFPNVMKPLVVLEKHTLLKILSIAIMITGAIIIHSA
jgi:drug/metabolite transporter (DMT)-like permease